MSRIRTVKPELFRHSGLYDAEIETNLPLRLAFAGLWTACDREGRFKWKPRELKLDVLPHDQIDFSRVLDALLTRGYLVKYVCGTDIYGCVPSWTKHQFINNRESGSKIPSPEDESSEIQGLDDASSTRRHALTVLSLREGKGKGKEKEEALGKGSARVADAPPRRRKKSAAIPIPEDFSLTPSLETWAHEKGFGRLPERIEHFKDWAIAGEKRYVDWDATFRNAVRGDWAHLEGKPNGNGKIGDPAMPTIGNQPADWLKGAI